MIHGEDDPLVPLRAGVATARAIPGAELVGSPGWATTCRASCGRAYVDAIARNADRAATRQAA